MVAELAGFLSLRFANRFNKEIIILTKLFFHHYVVTQIED